MKLSPRNHGDQILQKGDGRNAAQSLAQNPVVFSTALEHLGSQDPHPRWKQIMPVKTVSRVPGPSPASGKDLGLTGSILACSVLSPTNMLLQVGAGQKHQAEQTRGGSHLPVSTEVAHPVGAWHAGPEQEVHSSDRPGDRSRASLTTTRK